MKVKVIFSMRVGLLLLQGVGLLMAYPGSVLSAACDGVPDCQSYVQAPIHYGGWETRGWAYYCPNNLYYWNYSKNNHCFMVSENSYAENYASKFDATITNWCFKGEDISITLGCSAQQPPRCDSGCVAVE
jgi:hypothetical protein